VSDLPTVESLQDENERLRERIATLEAELALLRGTMGARTIPSDFSIEHNVVSTTPKE